MGFGDDLQGQTSHEAVLRLQDAEIRHLESIRKCISHRINADKNYANELKTIASLAQKFQNGGINTPLFEAWATVIKETEKLSQIIEEQANTLCRTALDRLCFLIGEKKNAKKLYDDERSRIDTDVRVLQGRVKHLHNEYERLMSRLQEDSARYHDLLNRKKGSAKLDDARNRYHRTSVKLHKVHNDYVILLRHAGLQQEKYSEFILPGLMEFQHKVQETFCQQSKEILQEYVSLTDFSSADYVNSFKTIHQAVECLQPKEEYNKFIESNKSPPYTPEDNTFDTSVLESYSGNLKANEIALNDLTLEALVHGRSQFEENLSTLRQKIENKEKDLQSKEDELAHIPAKDDMDNSHKKLLTSKKCETYQLTKDMAELNAKLQNYKLLYEMLNTPLAQLGDKNPPKGVDLDEADDLLMINNDKYDSQSLASTPDRRYSKGTLGEKMREGFQKIRTRLSSGNISSSASPAKPPSVVDLQNNHQVSASTEQLASPSSYQEVFNNTPASPTRRLEEEEWFHGVLPREEVQRLLINEGDHLVRESKQRQTGQTQYVLSVKWCGYKHFIIQGSEGAWRFEGPSFPTIQVLVAHQQQSGTPVTNKSQAILGQPICREKWEILNDDVQLEVKIGGGNFGDVYKGTYKGVEVAVKTCKENLNDDQKKKFLQEGRILKQYDHPNIVKFIGIAAHRQPVMIVMEYVPGGSLHKFLQTEGYKQSVKMLIKMCEDAAAGMAYLEKANCIHRDLAARNCLIGQKNIVKISDFGMSREDEIYIVSDGLKQIPIKWTAPEALNLGKYTSLSDVWSFGILIWEVFSLGANPYPGLSNQQARDRIEQGYRMPKPDKVDTPEQIYDVMLRCWQYEPERRLRFDRIYRELQRIRNSI